MIIETFNHLNFYMIIKRKIEIILKSIANSCWNVQIFKSWVDHFQGSLLIFNVVEAVSYQL